MSILTYNNVSLPYAMATSFSQEGVGDELSNTDLCYTKLDITVTCIINQAYLSMMAGQVGGVGVTPAVNPADIMTIVRSKLLQRRKALSYTFNGRQIIPAIQQGNEGTVDAKNGPIPQYCNIFDLNNTTWMLQFRIVAHYWERDLVTAASGQPPTIINQKGQTALSHRWSESESYDNCLMCTRTRNGKLIIRSDNADGVTIDTLRGTLITLQVPTGYLRQSSNYMLDPSGLGLAYTIVDKQQFKMPPKLPNNPNSQAYEASGTWRVRYGPNMNWFTRVGTATVTLKGAITTPQNTLLEMAGRICLAKIESNSAIVNPNAPLNAFTDIVGINNGTIITGAEVSVGMYENTVTMSVTAKLQGAVGRFASVMGYTGNGLTYTALSDNDGAGGATTNNPNYPVYGNPSGNQAGQQGILLAAARYYDPSIGDASLGADFNTKTGLIPGQGGKQAEQ